MPSTARSTALGSDGLTHVSDVLEACTHPLSRFKDASVTIRRKTLHLRTHIVCMQEEVPLGSLIPGFGTVRTVTLLTLSGFCAMLAWLGGATLFYLLLSKYFSPAAAHYSRNLYFDYTKPDAVATAHFLPDVQYSRALASSVSHLSLAHTISIMTDQKTDPA